MYVAYHDFMCKVEHFINKPDGVWLVLEGINFPVKAEYVIIV